MTGRNFTFIGQANRMEVLKAVYGVDVPEVLCVSYGCTPG